jgi:hypothetical protein
MTKGYDHRDLVLVHLDVFLRMGTAPFRRPLARWHSAHAVQRIAPEDVPRSVSSAN